MPFRRHHGKDSEASVLRLIKGSAVPWEGTTVPGGREEKEFRPPGVEVRGRCKGLTANLALILERGASVRCESGHSALMDSLSLSSTPHSSTCTIMPFTTRPGLCCHRRSVPWEAPAKRRAIARELAMGSSRHGIRTDWPPPLLGWIRELEIQQTSRKAANVLYLVVSAVGSKGLKRDVWRLQRACRWFINAS